MWDHLPKVIFLQNRGRQLLRIKSLRKKWVFRLAAKKIRAGCKKDRGWRQKKETRELHFHGEASQPGRQGQTDRLYNLEDCCQNLYISKFANCRKILSVSGCTQYFPSSGKIHEKERNQYQWVRRTAWAPSSYLRALISVRDSGGSYIMSTAWLIWAWVPLWENLSDKQNMALAQVLTGTVTEVAEYICLLLIRASLTGDMLCVQKNNQSKN